jgi:hypothetical protein
MYNKIADGLEMGDNCKRFIPLVFTTPSRGHAPLLAFTCLYCGYFALGQDTGAC